jgi:hypothetical protein
VIDVKIAEDAHTYIWTKVMHILEINLRRHGILIFFQNFERFGLNISLRVNIVKINGNLIKLYGLNLA